MNCSFNMLCRYIWICSLYVPQHLYVHLLTSLFYAYPVMLYVFPTLANSLFCNPWMHTSLIIASSTQQNNHIALIICTLCKPIISNLYAHSIHIHIYILIKHKLISNTWFDLYNSIYWVFVIYPSLSCRGPPLI